jgi:urease accessory protein
VQRVIAIRRPEDGAAASGPRARVLLPHDERHLRRKVIGLPDGGGVLVDLPEAVMLRAGDELVLEDGGVVTVAAATEDLCEVTARDPVHLAELAWHIGNRHLAAAISAERILIQRDHVIKAMLEGLGASVRDVSEPFQPVRGAYAGRAPDHHRHGHSHDHGG